MSLPSICNQPIQSPHLQPPPLLGSHTQGHYSIPALITPGPTRDNFYAPEPSEIIHTSQS